MKNIVVCYKWVADEVDIRINEDLSVDFSKAKSKISDYDKNAIEAASRAAKSVGGKAIGLSFGSDEVKASFKDVLSRGLDEGVWVKASDAEKADGAVTARALAAAIAKIEDVAMVVCAEGSSDNYARQIAPRIGAILDWPVITSVCGMEFDGNSFTTTRRMHDCMQTVKTELPAVVAVLPEINPAPIPGLKAVMEARKKTIVEYSANELGIDLTPEVDVLEIKGYVSDRKKVILSGNTNGDKISNLLNALRKEGVL
ncbi:MAG: Electron transfer flavoprotein subunit beta [Pelotomaculum sp. PtaB.Bin104]|nr:MAG: Electron transfer flavoprotein subunit beta [Pelotomaculum sp. PtaB.Bin104]